MTFISDFLILAALDLACGAWAQLPYSMWAHSSPEWYQTCLPRIAGQILNHWATREVPISYILDALVFGAFILEKLPHSSTQLVNS